MTVSELKQSSGASVPPAGLPVLVEALWWAARGEWEQSHTLAQDVDTREGAAVHAYLHRVEGDAGNAGYWYRQAGRPMAKGSLQEEWEQLAGELLGG